MSYEEQSIKKYNTFTKKYEDKDVDIELFYNKKKICNLDMVSWQIYREMAPIYTFGNTPPKKRTIIGTLIPKESVYKISEDDFEIILTALNEYNCELEETICKVKLMYQGFTAESLIAGEPYQFIAEYFISWHVKKYKDEEDHTGQIWNEYNQCWSWL